MNDASRPSKERTTGERASGERVVGERAAADRLFGDRPPGDRAEGRGLALSKGPMSRAAARGFAARRSKLLLVGTVETVRTVVRALRVDPRTPITFAGVLLSDAPKAGLPERIGRIPVWGALSTLEVTLARQIGRPIDGLVMCGVIEPRASRRRLLDRAAQMGLDLWVAERSGDFAELRPYSAEDIIGPGALLADPERLRALINGRRVLVTGAGGSIGSQLCARIARLSPARLTLLDNSEYNLFTIHHQIQAEDPRLPLTHALCDVREAAAVQRWFEREQPQIVLHAAALKQLPLVESHPSEGVLTNVLGTKVVAQAALSVGAQMVLVSTDKAVDPTAVMGATKRLAELYCQALDSELGARKGPRVLAARLGNVLGSAGSVVQIFERQIAAGGPVTVTDPDATRFFITIPQAADFLLSTAADSLDPGAERGCVHVMDMGEPLKIVDLARDLIRLSGRRPDADVKVSFVGMRAGEKLTEELIARDEWVAERRPCGIYMVKAPPRSLRMLENALDNLIEAARARRDDQVRTMLTALVAPQDAGAGVPAKAG
jgi:FlaA1/EpsC-like NDP-sugar epimerase